MKFDASTISEAELMAYADDRLQAGRRAAVEGHLSSHPADAAAVAAWRRQNEAIRRIFEPAAPEPLPARLDVREMVPAERGGTVSGMRLAATVALCLALGGLAGWYGRGAVRPAEAPVVAALAGEAIDAHRLYAGEKLHPVEVKAGQKAHLSAWLSRRLDRPLTIPDLRPAGYSLVGGRLLPAGAGPAAQFMYEDGSGRRVTLYVIPTGQDAETRMRYVERARTGAYLWRDASIACALVGDIPREDLHRLALQSYRQLG